jgi:hypothetical protein
MKFKQLLYHVLLSTVVAVGLSACIKNDVKELGSAGRTFIKILEAPLNQFFFEPFTGNRTVDLVSLRREANSNAELNKSATVTLTVDTAAISAYNRANNASFELLPDSLFSVTTAGITKSGPLTYTVTFAPGEFAKEFSIALNGSKWNLSHTYSMPFMVSDPGGLAVAADHEKAVTLISIKNKYDGRYEMTGSFVDAANAALTAKSPTEVHLVTTGPNSVRLHNAGTSVGGFKDLFPILNAGAESGYGGFTPEFVLNANDNVVEVKNWYGQPNPSNTRGAVIDPSGVNKWDPATKTLQVKFFMTQPSVITTAPHIRVSFDMQFRYLGPR